MLFWCFGGLCLLTTANKAIPEAVFRATVTDNVGHTLEGLWLLRLGLVDSAPEYVLVVVVLRGPIVDYRN